VRCLLSRFGCLVIPLGIRAFWKILPSKTVSSEPLTSTLGCLSASFADEFLHAILQPSWTYQTPGALVRSCSFGTAASRPTLFRRQASMDQSFEPKGRPSLPERNQCRRTETWSQTSTKTDWKISRHPSATKLSRRFSVGALPVVGIAKSVRRNRKPLRPGALLARSPRRATCTLFLAVIGKVARFDGRKICPPNSIRKISGSGAQVTAFQVSSRSEQLGSTVIVTRASFADTRGVFPRQRSVAG